MLLRLTSPASGFITDAIGQTLSTLALFVATPLILNLASATLYGFWLTLVSVLAYVGLTEAGICVAVARRVAELSEGPDQPLNRALSSGAALLAASAIVLIAIALAICPFIGGWFSIPADAETSFIAALLITVAATALKLILFPYGAVIFGYRRLALQNVIALAAALTALVVTLGLLQLGSGLVSLAIGEFFRVAATAILQRLYVRRLFPGFKIRPRFAEIGEIKTLFNYGVFFQLGHLAQIVTTQAPVIIVSIAFGAATVTPFVLTGRIVQLVATTIAPKISLAIFPTVSIFLFRGDRDALRRIFLATSRYSVRLSVMGGVLFILSNQVFIDLWVGPEYFGGVELNMAYAVLLIVLSYSRGISGLVQFSGHVKRWGAWSVAEAAIGVGLSLALIKHGEAAVIASFAFARLVTNGIFIPIAACEIVALSWRSYLWQGVLDPLLRSAPAIAATWLAAVWLPIANSWPGLFILGAICVVMNSAAFEGVAFVRSKERDFFSRLRAAVNQEASLNR